MDQRVQKDRTDLLVFPAPLVNPDPQGALAVKDPKDTKERGVQQGPQGNKAIPETAEMMGIKAVLVLKEERALEGSRDRKAYKAPLGNRETQGMLDHEGALEDRVNMELQEGEDSLGTKANLVDRVPLGFVDNREKREQREPKAQQDQEDEAVTRAIGDHPEYVERWEEMELQELRAILDTGVEEVHVDTRVPLVRKEAVAHVDLQDLRALAEGVDRQGEEERLECLQSVDLTVNLESLENQDLSGTVE